MENSRRPSEENIYLTPPWMEDERQSCGVSIVVIFPIIIINFIYPQILGSVAANFLSYLMSQI